MRQSVKIAAVIALLLLAALILSWFALPRADAFLSNLTFAYAFANAFPLLIAFTLIFCLTLRPLSSLLWSVFVATLFVVGSNFKFSVVSQPMLITDILLLSQVVGNMDLFGGYFVEQWYIWLSLLAILAIPVYLTFLEKPITKRIAVRIAPMLLALVAAFYMPDWALKQSSVTQKLYRALNLPFYERNPIATVKESGLFASLMRTSTDLYFELPKKEGGAEAKKERLVTLAREATRAVASDGPANPDVIVVINEAFFDLRLVDAQFPNEFYAPWDRLKERTIHGFIRVDTYGGATLRTEFSALTGIPLEIFPGGVDYPYFSIVRYPFKSLPRYLRSLGYGTIAIHPYAATFWNRHVVYPHLGFDTFVSVSSFADAERDGPYVSDAAVCEKVIDVLDESSQPVYMFVVTMENHGPWSFERGSPNTSRQFDKIKEPANVLALNRYLYHLENGMRMAKCLIDSLASRRRPAVLFFFGDHAPALPEVYRELTLENPWESVALRAVPYVVWRSWTDVEGNRDLHISYLPSFLLSLSGLQMDDFFAANAYMYAQCGIRVNKCALDNELKRAYTKLVYDQFGVANYNGEN